MMRYEEMTSFMVMDIVREASHYQNCVHFEIGQPDLQPSPLVCDAFHQAIASNRFSYTESFGLYELRKKISNHYLNTYKVNIAPERILLTPGSSGAFLIAYALALKSGGTLALTDPSYPCYKNFAHFLNINPVAFAVDKSESYQLHPDQLRKTKIEALQISSPANPTGNLYSTQRLQSLNQYCIENGISFISDELYHGLVYDGIANTALEFNDKAYVINGFSKYFCMPGARLGWIIVPEEQIRDAEVIAQNLFICPPTLSQYAALSAFDYEYLAVVKNEFARRRDFLYQELSSIFEVENKPQGAFYLWANVSAHCNDSKIFAHKMLKEIQVASAPGVDFGNNQTNKYLRFAYTRNIEQMAEGILRIKNWL